MDLLSQRILPRNAIFFKFNYLRYFLFISLFLFAFITLGQKLKTYDEYSANCVVKEKAIEIIHNFETHNTNAIKKYIPNFNKKIEEDQIAIYSVLKKKDFPKKNIPVYFSNSFNEYKYKRTYYYFEEGALYYLLQLDIEKVGDKYVLYLNGSSEIKVEEYIETEIYKDNGFIRSNPLTNNQKQEFFHFESPFFYLGDYLMIDLYTLIVSLIIGIRKRRIFRYLLLFYLVYFIYFKINNYFQFGFLGILFTFVLPFIVGFLVKKGEETWYSKLLDFFGSIFSSIFGGSNSSVSEGMLLASEERYKKDQTIAAQKKIDEDIIRQEEIWKNEAKNNDSGTSF